jgi:hypothetical protein
MTLERCAEPTCPQLSSYVTVEVPGTYWVDVTFEREWTPAEYIPMPHHHATRLELTNEAELPALAAHRTQRVRLTIAIESREIYRAGSRDTGAWRAIYRARILEACVPSST